MVVGVPLLVRVVDVRLLGAARQPVKVDLLVVRASNRPHVVVDEVRLPSHLHEPGLRPHPLDILEPPMDPQRRGRVQVAAGQLDHAALVAFEVLEAEAHDRRRGGPVG